MFRVGRLVGGLDEEKSKEERHMVSRWNVTPPCSLSSKLLHNHPHAIPLPFTGHSPSHSPTFTLLASIPSKHVPVRSRQEREQ